MGLSSSKQNSNQEDDKIFIEKEVKGHQVVIWSKSHCGYCSATKSLFRRPQFQGVDVKVYEINSMSNGRSIQSILASMTGQRTVPSVWVGGKFVGGNSETQAAHRNGKLKSMLEK